MRPASLVLALFLTACATTNPPPLQRPVLIERLYCGLAIPGGGVVSEAELRTFLDEVVVPRFPDGFTVYRADGVFKGGHEQSFVIEIIHGPGSAFEREVEEIAEEYRRRFRQVAVLRVSMPGGMDTID